jgi:hypothetical protein
MNCRYKYKVVYIIILLLKPSLLFFNIFNKSKFIIKNNENLLGKWRLRYTNNKILLKNSLIYINISPNDKIKIKNTNFNGLIGIKVSNKGKITKCKKKLLSKQYDVTVEFTHCNTYSYSFLGIEIPESKINSKQHSLYYNYTIEKKDNSLYIYENKIHNKLTKYYYIFDLIPNNIKLPHIEISLGTLICSQIISFIINILLVNINYLT